MSGNTFGKIFRLTTWGESHGPALGAVIDGCPPRLPLTAADIDLELARRRPGSSIHTTSRREPDKVEILSGVFQGQTTGTPISLIIHNRDIKSEAYEPLKEIFRPGHGDYTYQAKYGIRDHRGGGRASARETAARVAAGAVAQKILDTVKSKSNCLHPGIGGHSGPAIPLGIPAGKSHFSVRTRTRLRLWRPGCRPSNNREIHWAGLSRCGSRAVRPAWESRCLTSWMRSWPRR